jgi:hypothetical protein
MRRHARRYRTLRQLPRQLLCPQELAALLRGAAAGEAQLPLPPEVLLIK